MNNVVPTIGTKVSDYNTVSKLEWTDLKLQPRVYVVQSIEWFDYAIDCYFVYYHTISQT